MKQTLYLLQDQNNYFNRKVILQGVRNEEEVAYNENLYGYFDDINIPTFDSLNCEVIINVHKNFGVVAYIPDYAVIITTLDNDEKELTRRFVDKYQKIRGEQYKVILKRDIKADYLNNILTATAYIEKGYCNRSNPLIYNSEGITFNQIKQREKILNDEIGYGPFIVGYIARSDAGNPYSADASVDAYNPFGDFTNYEDLPQKVKDLINNVSYVVKNNDNEISINFTAYFNWFLHPIFSKLYDSETILDTTSAYNLKSTRIIEVSTASDNYLVEWKMPLQTNLTATLKNEEFMQDFVQNLNKEILNTAVINVLENINYLTENELLQYDNIIYKQGTNYFKLHLNINELQNEYSIDLSNNNNIYLEVKRSLEASLDNDDSLQLQNLITGFLKLKLNTINVSIETINGPQVNATIPMTRNKLIDSPYDMFVIPYRDYWIVKNGIQKQCYKNLQLNIAEALSEKLGSRLYDLQLLPYCPMEYLPKSTSLNALDFDATTLQEDIDYCFIKGTNDAIEGVIFFSKISKKTFKIATEDAEFNNVEINPYYIKQKDATRIYRLVSPNFSGIYEFSLEKNGGTLPYLNVDIDYKPYQPFIRLSLNYGGINYFPRYSRDIKDARGLICGGDFSLAIISSAWTEYEINNKNYQLMFDRDIKNLEINQQIAREELKYKNITGTMGKSFGSAMYGSQAGPYGAIAGATIGLGAGVLNSYLTADWQQRQQKEELDYKTDKFNYSLQNVQAIPYSLTKVSALNSVFKNYPILEIYDATNEEKEAFINKLHYEGFTIMALGQIQNYIDIENESYIKAQLIRLEDASIDTNIANELYNEVNKGFYIDIGGYSNGN